MPTVRLVQTPFAQGEVIGGRYRVERIIAEGGMGVIVAARHLELEEVVAIKFLKDEFASKPEIVGRFAREAKAAAKIKCEYTATVHDVGISADRGPYIVMEYLEGEDLETVLQADGKIPFARATELMMQAGEALAVAHANGIIHRDIKPANLFLVKKDHGVPIIKVLDFGVSKTALTGNVFGGTISLVKTQALVGSPIYMSPEQLRSGKNDEIAFTADIWSLGAVLYELITGDTAFNGSSITELCASVLETEPRPITDRAPDVPSGLADAIMKCLRKEPSQRWQSIAELVVALAPYAPKRARMSVERVVAVSKAAGLIANDFSSPASLPPPGLASTVTNTLPPPVVSLPPRSKIDELSPVSTTFKSEGGGAKRAATIAALVAAVVGILAALYFVVQNMPKDGANAATAEKASPPASAAAATTAKTEAAPSPATNTTTPSAAPVATPQHANPNTNPWAGPAQRPGAAAPAWRPGATKPPPTTPGTKATAAAEVTAAPTAPTAQPPKQSTTSAAIDDRK